jgi:hypothetical protein
VKTTSSEEKVFVPRFARQRLKDGGRSEPRLIAYWRDTPAYVLLGDPGAGKTEAVKREAHEVDGEVISATNFGVVPPPKPPKGAAYFIDGLDEWRADASSETEALNSIRKKLVALKKPKFRITCREIDWRGTVDGGALKEVSPDGEIVELHLEPLSDADVQTILANSDYKIADPADFWKKLDRLGLDGWLRNPMALELILKAVVRGNDNQLPKSKLDIFQLGCERLAIETNPHHRAARRRAPPTVDQILNDAGKLFAMLLLAGETGINVSPDINPSAKLSFESLPTELAFGNIQVALASQLFSTSSGYCSPRHRTIAEYLGAKAIGGLVEEGLPISRVLALMSGQDGGIVEPLRGLHAWMAVACPRERTQLIDRDPLGVVMYGDVRAFSRDEKLHIFKALAEEAERYARFRNGAWNAHPFGALGTRDMVAAMQEIMSSSERTMAHQSLLDCVTDAIQFGDDLPEMLPHLERVVPDATYGADVRLAAVQAWLAQAKSNVAVARQWLDDIKAGLIADPNDSLRGALLKSLYPAYLTPTEALNYFYQTTREDSIGGYGYFWSFHLLSRTPAGRFAELADAFVALPIDRKRLGGDFELPDILARVIAAALRESGHESPTRRVVDWLMLGRSEHWGVAIKGDAAVEIGKWLSQDVETLKRIYMELCQQVQTEVTGDNSDLWSQAAFLYGANLPGDWYNWLLTIGETSQPPEFVRFCIESAARAVLNGLVDFDIQMEDVEYWVARNRTVWPQAEKWLSDVWSQPIDHYEARHFKENHEYEIERLKKQELRHQSYAEHFAKSTDGLISVGLLYRLALAYKNRLSGIHGDMPHERLQDLIGGGKAELETALKHLKASLTRPDLPTVGEILKSGLESKEHFVRPACLVAADIAFGENPGVVQTWDDDLFKQLVAFWLTDGTYNEPDWYAAAIRSKPQLVADVMVPFAVQTIRKRPDPTVTGLWALARDDDLADFTRAVVPAILEKFPVRANETQLIRLVEQLLPAALKHLEPQQLAAIAAKKLGNTSMDAGQRIAWLALCTFQNSQVSAKALVKFLGKSQSRVQHLIHALVGHADRDMNHLTFSVEIQSLLIEILGPNVSPAWPNGGDWVRPRDEVRGLLRHMIETLSRSTDPNAGRELARLRGLTSLHAWFISIDGAISDNTRLVRAANFVHASPKAVALMLANRAPANAADLQALVVDQLFGLEPGLEKQIRGNNSNILDQFWTDKLADGSRNPQTENVCRDRLMPLLRSRLQPLDVQLDKEIYAAGDKRMDLRAAISVGGKRRMVPIEIKKDSHINVWTAWRDQLDKQYLNEPDTAGYGIYLVLWFGRESKAFDGVKPKSADEMSVMLRDRIPADDRFRIAVVVMDLSQNQTQIEPTKKKNAA